MSGSLRDAMPQCATWIDDLRAAFGRESIDKAIRDGLRRGGFCCQENGETYGTPTDWSGAVHAVMLPEPSPPTDATRKGAKR